MIDPCSNIVLIGMPGAGKSTVGVILAKRTSRHFVDTDLLIQVRQKRTLQDILDRDGHQFLRQVEEEVLLELAVHDSVIATGGSAVYGDRGMAHLKSDGVVVFLQVDLPVLEFRVNDYATRGIAKRPEQDFADLFLERTILYEKYADFTIKSDDLTHEEVCGQIMALVR
jgi:shikimate kinase